MKRAAWILAAAMTFTANITVHAGYDFEKTRIADSDTYLVRIDDTTVGTWRVIGGPMNDHSEGPVTAFDFKSGEAVRVEFDRDAYEKYRPNEGLSLYRRDGRSGLVNENGTVVVEFGVDADKIEPQGEGFYKLRVNYENKIFDASGHEVLNVGKYANVYRLSGGIYAVMGNSYQSEEYFDGIYMLRSRTIDTAYNTRIRTFINNAEIPCYLVGGYCTVIAEDLRGYGFDVFWNADEQRLDISRNPEYYNIDPAEIPQKGENDTPYADVVRSDVKAYYEGKEIPAYHIDGRTLIRPESIEDEGISFNYADGVLNISIDGLEIK